MPEENGIELAHQFQQEDPDLSIMIVSGYIPEHTENLPFHWKRLPKPFQRKQLLQMLESMEDSPLIPHLRIVHNNDN